MKNILFIGLGSIGQRHLKNLKKINKNYKFFALRKKKNSPELDLTNKVIGEKFRAFNNNVTEISEKVSKKLKFHSVFICNPSSLHVKTSLTYIRNCKNLFIEKPLSNNLKNIKKLLQKIKLNKINCAVGYQLRYHPILQKIKKLIETKKLGEIKSAYLRNGYYLPYHHKYEDYKKGYAANKKLGGGVILCFIHEIDYANYLFERPLYMSCDGGKKSKLKIDVEDHAKMIIDYKNTKKNFKVKIDIDFIEKIEKRFCKIIFEKGVIYWNLKKDYLNINFKNKSKIQIKSSFKNRNDLFFKEMKEVMRDFENKKEPKNNLKNGITSLQLAMAAKESMRKNKPIKIKDFL